MNFTYIEARFLKNIIIIILNLNKESDSIGLEKLVDSQAPETSWAPGTRCARSGQVIWRTFSQVLKTPNKHRSLSKVVLDLNKLK